MTLAHEQSKKECKCFFCFCFFYGNDASGNLRLSEHLDSNFILASSKTADIQYTVILLILRMIHKLESFFSIFLSSNMRVAFLPVDAGFVNVRSYKI